MTVIKSETVSTSIATVACDVATKPEAVALETASLVAAPIEITSLTASTAKAASAKISCVKGASVSIALRENRGRRTERQHDRDNNANFGAHSPSPLFGIGAKETGWGRRIFLDLRPITHF
jgi:hypothetical protein